MITNLWDQASSYIRDNLSGLESRKSKNYWKKAAQSGSPFSSYPFFSLVRVRRTVIEIDSDLLDLSPIAANL